MMEPELLKPKGAARTWIRRLGVAGFLFFLVKGILWLIVPALIAYFALN